MGIWSFDEDGLAENENWNQRIRSELRQGERLVWAGQPLPGRHARQAWPMVLFGIPWTAFSVFWIVAASGILAGGVGPRGGGSFTFLGFLFPLFGVPFVLIGLGMLSSPYWVGRMASRTSYGLTDRRAIICQAGWGGSIEVRSFGPAELTRIQRIEYPDGSGDLIFEEFLLPNRNQRGYQNITQRRGFLAIDRVREVEDLIRKTLPPDRADSGPA